MFTCNTTIHIYIQTFACNLLANAVNLLQSEKSKEGMFFFEKQYCAKFTGRMKIIGLISEKLSFIKQNLLINKIKNIHTLDFANVTYYYITYAI